MEGKLSSRLAKNLLAKMVETGEDPETLMNAGGVRFVSDEKELEVIVRGIIKENPKPVEDYKKGNTNSLQFLIGKAMAKTKGQADPAVLKTLFEKELNK